MNATIPFLMYHAIADDVRSVEAPYTTTPAAFEAQMRYLSEAGYVSLTVSQVLDAWHARAPLPRRAVVVTFDDGFACLPEVALPIMRRHGVRATAYLISGYLDRMARFDVALNVRSRPMLARSQVLELVAEGVEIGSHSVNHEDLRTLAPAGLRYELQRSRADLEDLTGRAVRSFSFPRGLFDRRVHDAVAQAGYAGACSTMPGLNDRDTDRILLRRAQVGVATDLPALRGLLRFGGHPAGLARARARAGLIDCLAAIRGRDPMNLYRRPLRGLFRGTDAS
jgi:peptidoglycan/xylan/chitin deacetylase (PgdA/CDA1 family)